MTGIEVGTAMAIASAAMAAASMVAQSQAAKKQSKFNAAVARNNAIIAKQKARAQEAAFRKKFAFFQGETATGFAKGGVVVNTGSPLEVLGDNAAEAELEALMIRYGGEIQADDFAAQAGASLAAGKGAFNSGMLAAGATILSGARKGFKTDSPTGVKTGGQTAQAPTGPSQLTVVG